MAEFTLFYRKHSASNQRNNRVYPKGREPNRQFAYSGIPGDSDIDT